MRVLVACEFSGVVRDAFAAKGHDAWSCDLLPTESPGNHLVGDVRNFFHLDWDLMIAHPPCTYLANSGVRWLYGGKGAVVDQTRWAHMVDAAQFFNECLAAPISRIVVENPIMHSHARKIVSQTYTQIIHPWQFGHGETKATCLWLKRVRPLTPTAIVAGRQPNIHKLPPSVDRWKLRSKTYVGIAAAMASQWG